MRIFALDVWEDLRRKRLRPVAIGLLAAVIALPLLPLGPDAENAPPQPGGAVSPADDAVLVGLEDERSASSSRLNVFKAKNPFEGPLGSSAASAESSSSDAASGADGASTSAGSSRAASTGGGSSASAAGGSSATAPATQPRSTPSTGGGTVGGGSGGGGASGDSAGGDTPGDSEPGAGSEDGSRTAEGKEETSYTFTIDLRFGTAERVKTLRGLKRLSALPSDRAPVLVFLGVTATRHSAVFLVDAGVRQQGEGACSPSPGTCTFLYLRLDQDRDTHTVIGADGTIHRLRLLDIERVRTDAQTASPGGSTATAAGRGAARPFALSAPALVDEQE